MRREPGDGVNALVDRNALAGVVDSCGDASDPTPILAQILVHAVMLMLIAMSYNGYILSSIVVGAIVGHFVSTWDHLTMELPDQNVPAQIDVSDPYVLSSGEGGQSSGLVGSQVQSAITAKNAASADEAACYGESKGACCA